MLVPDLYVYTLKFLAYKKRLKNEKKKKFPPNNIFFLTFFYATFQCGRYNVFKQLLFYFFAHKKLKKSPQKVAYLVHLGVFKSLQP